MKFPDLNFYLGENDNSIDFSTSPILYFFIRNTKLESFDFYKFLDLFRKVEKDFHSEVLEFKMTFGNITEGSFGEIFYYKEDRELLTNILNKMNVIILKEQGHGWMQSFNVNNY
jgi:hypothetical protein